MTTSSNENIFRVTGRLCGDFTGHQWISRTNSSDVEFDVFFDLGLYQQLKKQWRRRWFETPWRSLWRHCNDIFVLHLSIILKLEVSINGLCQGMTQRYTTCMQYTTPKRKSYTLVIGPCAGHYISLFITSMWIHNAIMTWKCFTHYLFFLWGIRQWITLPSQRASNADVR